MVVITHEMWEPVTVTEQVVAVPAGQAAAGVVRVVPTGAPSVTVIDPGPLPTLATVKV
jgi:hypothetical protein